jgi:hypothetical protein
MSARIADQEQRRHALGVISVNDNLFESLIATLLQYYTGSESSDFFLKRGLRGGYGATEAAASFAISVSISLLLPAIPRAPTTSPLTRIGMPPRSDMMPAVMKAVRP